MVIIFVISTNPDSDIPSAIACVKAGGFSYDFSAAFVCRLFSISFLIFSFAYRSDFFGRVRSVRWECGASGCHLLVGGFFFRLRHSQAINRLWNLGNVPISVCMHLMNIRPVHSR